MKNLIESESLEIPSELPAMTLPGVVFFPKAMMPIYIFEKRYRLMVEEILDSHRMFCLAASKESDSGTVEGFEEIASAGLVRVCRGNPDGTSFLLLQGLSRIRISKVLREEPYRVVAVEPIESIIEAPLAESRKEIEKLIKENHKLGGDVTDDMLSFLNPLHDDEAYVDLVAFTLCKETMRKQKILETLELSKRAALLVSDIRCENERLSLLKQALGEWPDEDFDAN
ncbi:MAG: LON peptidase substrate-binding domain-containing protein [Opitutae bacterium]|jgi:Lon protease-like protein|nr:LON peptidase substrate-binding domain-containing protein [Opitutae bacterium]